MTKNDHFPLALDPGHELHPSPSTEMPGGVPGPHHPGRRPWGPRPPHPQVDLHDPVLRNPGAEARDTGGGAGRSSSVILCGAQYNIQN